MDSVLTTIYFCCMGVGLLLPLAHVVLDFLDLDFDAGDADAPLPFNIMALSFGVLVRMHEHELERAGDDAEKRAAMQAGREKSLAAFEKLAQYLEEAIDYEAVPIRKLVSIQLESGLLVMQYLREHR